MRIRWTRRADSDLYTAYDFIAQENRRAAARMIGRIRQATSHLEKQPRIGRLGKLDGTHELVVTGTPFIVVYRVVNGLVEILRVIHGAQHWPDDTG